MPNAAIQYSPTSHPGQITGPGAPTVKIGGVPAAVVGDIHACAFPNPPGHPPNVIAQGSEKVKFGGKPAARVGDLCSCGAKIEAGASNVNIG